jgi:triacylglycerol lipase
MGFDAVRVGGFRIRGYYPGIDESFRAGGNRVFNARVHPTAGIAHRAAELRELIDRSSPHEPVHLFAHSMGGLDARYMISRLGMADRVLSLTTIGTPHRGSPFAEWGIRHLGRLARPWLKRLGIADQAFYDLTTESCRAFNEAVPNASKVRYFAVAGRCSIAWLGPQWLIPHEIVRRAEGPNDGLVSVASATWGELTEVWAGDHVSLINWLNVQALILGVWRCRRRQYARLVRRLADAGY